MPKSYGGLGFRRMWDQNKALIAKLDWVILSSEDRLWVEIMKAKYSLMITSCHVVKKYDASWVWQGISKSICLIWKEACLAIGDG